MEPPGKEKERAPKTDLEAESSGRTEDSREVLGGCKVYSRGPDQMEGYGRGPMLHKEYRGFSQVKHKSVKNTYLNKL